MMKNIFKIIALLTISLSYAASLLSSELGCGIIYSGRISPDDYESFAPIPAGDWWIEEPFHTKIIRITDSGQRYQTWAEHRYSSVCAFNHTGDYFICTHKPAEVWLHDGRNGIPIRQLKLYHTFCVWSMVEKDILYYCYENELRSYNVVTDEEQIVRKFSGEAELDFGGNEGDISNDGRYICLSSTNRTRWFVYDLFENIKYEVLAVDDTNLIDAAQISPSGKYVVIEYGYKAANDYQEGVGCCVHDARTMQFIRNIYYHKTQHNDVGFDSDGDEAMFIPDVQGDFAGAGPSAVLSIKLETGEKRVIHQYEERTWLAYHFAQRCCETTNDYVFAGAYNKGEVDPGSSNWKPYWNEILAIPTDTVKETIRLCHHRCGSISPRPSVNRQGDRIIFDSDLYSRADWSDVFMITLEEPDTIPPLKPENARMDSSRYDNISLVWDQPAAAEDGDLPRNYQIYRDSLFLGYAQDTYYTDTTVTADQSYIYRIFSIDESAVKSEESAELSVHTGADSEPPAVTKVVSLGLRAIAIHFDEELDITEALRTDHYTISAGIVVENVVMAGSRNVLLKTSQQNGGKNYSIYITGICDASLNRNRIQGITREFIAIAGSDIALNDYRDSFNIKDKEMWEFRRPELWSYAEDQGRTVFGTNTSDYTYPGPGRMGTYALVKDKIFTDFTLTCQARLVDSREFEFVWNYQDDYNYNYVMFHKLPHNNELFVLVDSMRYTIMPFTDFTRLDDNDYHRVRVQVKDCHFSVCFDDSIVVEGQDCTFSYGKVGMGSFGGWVYFDNFSIEIDKEYISNVSDEPDVREPVQCELLGNYPNPFNPSTKIVYSLQKDQHIKLTIYNLKGQVIEVLVNEPRHSGMHSVTWEAPHLPSGLYFYELRGDHFSQQRKLLLLK